MTHDALQRCAGLGVGSEPDEMMERVDEVKLGMTAGDLWEIIFLLFVCVNVTGRTHTHTHTYLIINNDIKPGQTFNN